MRAELDGDPVTLARPSGTWPPAAASSTSRACTRLRWPLPGTFRCGFPTCGARCGGGRWSRPAAWAVYLARHYARQGYEEIGRYLGGRDHTTILHSCRQAGKMLQSDPAVRKAETSCTRKLWKT